MTAAYDFLGAIVQADQSGKHYVGEVTEIRSRGRCAEVRLTKDATPDGPGWKKGDTVYLPVARLSVTPESEAEAEI